jgi:hypothetical protein
METKMKNEKQAKEFIKSKIKIVPPTSSLHVSSGTLEEHIVIGHSRNSRKVHYFQGCRD